MNTVLTVTCNKNMNNIHRMIGVRAEVTFGEGSWKMGIEQDTYNYTVMFYLLICLVSKVHYLF